MTNKHKQESIGSEKGITFKKHLDKTQTWSPWELDKKNQEILFLKGKKNQTRA